MSESDFLAAYVVYSTLENSPIERRYWYVCFSQNVSEAVRVAAMSLVDELNEARGYKDAETEAPYERDDDIASAKVKTPALGYVAQARDLNHTQVDLKRIKTIPEGFFSTETKDIKYVGTVGAFGVEYFGGWDLIKNVGERTFNAVLNQEYDSDTSDDDYEDTPWEKLKSDYSFASDASSDSDYDDEKAETEDSEDEYDFDDYEETDEEIEEEDYRYNPEEEEVDVTCQ